MKVVCSQSELNAALQLVSRAVATRRRIQCWPMFCSQPMQAAIASASRALISTSVFRLLWRPASTAAVRSRFRPGFLERSSPVSRDTPITLVTDDAGDQVELTSLRLLSDARYAGGRLPRFTDGREWAAAETSGVWLVQALKGTLFASSADEAKQLLTGVHLRFSHKSLEAAATDGHRLAVLEVDDALHDAAPSDDSESDGFAVTLPARSLREVERLMAGWRSEEPVSLFCDRGQVVFLAADQMVTSRTLEGTYPNYRQLIPDGFTRTISLDRRALIAALERIAVLADQHNNVVKFSTQPEDGVVQLSADAQDVGRGSSRFQPH